MHFRDVLESIKWNKRERARNNWRRIVMQFVNGNCKVNVDATRANETESEENDSQWTFDNSISFHSTFPYGACVRVMDLSNLQSKNKLTDYMLDSLLESLPNLIELGLYNCYTVTDKLIKRLPRSLCPLMWVEKLSLEFDYHWGELMILELKNSPFAREEDVLNIVMNSPKLKKVVLTMDMSGTSLAREIKRAAPQVDVVLRR
ncbi:10193_t:CDS:2 [Paraglomus occultum]|uniref:10193_t:CDS:1 n=1 Tax=Paraglomus occultum TaxID=144539 RepID=A0A9N9FYE3_9GLOM|nr:10193_t:CDS:2 [Paraglomus occultum]